jgi:hypothetical protein
MNRYTVSDTASGYKTLAYNNGKEIRIHSAYDPVREAERAVSSFQKGKAAHVIVCGMGLAYHIGEIRKKYPSCSIIAVEKDTDVVDAARKINPEFISGIQIIQSRGDLQSIFEEMDMTQFRGTAVYYHRPSYALFRDFYDGMIADINQYISSKLSDLLTRFEFEERWIENILRNVHHTFISKPVISLFGKFPGYPGIIVSAGPSLRKNIHLLGKLRDRALIVCVDTAFKILEKHGISPHIVMTLDAQKHSIRHFLGMKDEHAVLLADLVSYPVIMRDFRGRKIISSTSKYYTDTRGNHRRETTPVVDWIERHRSPIGDIQSGGSVATSLFDLLLNLGCSQIILVGQDLAYTGREIHCSGSHHNDDWLPTVSRFINLDTINQNVIRKRKIKRVTAYKSAGSVISDFVFDLYRGWFEDSAGKIGIPVINATEGGAMIAHTIETPLGELMDKIPRKALSPEDILEKILTAESDENPGDLIRAISSAITDIDRARSISGSCRTGGRMLSEEEINGILDSDNISKLISPFLKKTFIYLSRHPEISNEKSSGMLMNEIESAAVKMLRFLKTAENTLKCIDLPSI